MAASHRATGRISGQIWALGWVSLLTDAASEIVYPFLPELLRLVGAGAASLGVVEGVSEAVSAACKVGFGTMSDRLRRRKPFAVLGYVLAALARPLYALAGGAWQVVAIRSTDRIGKGMRGPPRDALLAAGVPRGERARAFGVQRMMDNLGGAIGPVLGFLLIHFAGVPLRTLFVLSVVPGFAAVLVLVLAVREAPAETPAPQKAPAGEPLPSAAKRFMVAFAVFSLAASADSFLLQRLLDLGLAASLIPIAWVSLQLAKSLVNIPGGRASDRFGHRKLLVLAWLLYGVVYAAFAAVSSVAAFWVLMIVYAIYYGLAEGGQRAILADAVPSGAHARAFGYQLAIEGGAGLVANAAFGLAYVKAGAAWAFGVTGAVAVVAAGLLAVLATPARTSGRSRPPGRPAAGAASS